MRKPAQPCPLQAHRRPRLLDAPGRIFFAALLSLLMIGCASFDKPTLPGETNVLIDKVTFQDDLSLDPDPLVPLLSLRADTLLIGGGPYNPWRAAEDRRRLRAFWENFGYFDAEVAKAEIAFNADQSRATVHWRLNEGPRYRLHKISIEGAPAAFEPALRAALPFRTGDPIDLQTQRIARHALADVLRDAGHLHAEVYSRAYVDSDAKTLQWTFFVDAGPETSIQAIHVLGARQVSPERILARSGYQPGDTPTLSQIRKRELDLMDTGAFAIARIRPVVTTEFETDAVPYESHIPPDTGGFMKDTQVDAEGRFRPREDLPEAIDLEIEVVEASRIQGSADLGIHLDLERIDPYVASRLMWRNALGELNHLSLDARLGYGIRYRGEVHDPLGLYGAAQLMWQRPGTFGRLGDLRLALSFNEDLYPGYHWRQAAAALSARFLLDTGLILDFGPRFRWDQAVGLGEIDPQQLADLRVAAPAPEGHLGGDLRASLIWDTRNDGVEALDGHLIALNLSAAPIGEHQWLRGELDLRLFVPFDGPTGDLGLAFRAKGGWVHGLTGDLPPGLRLFGGGAWGHRGFAERRLSLYAQRHCDANGCQDAVPLGAASLFEGSVEFRWLPYRKQFGVVAFADLGGIGRNLNPFEDAFEVAAGLGIRARIWHIPVALDFAYRITDGTPFQAPIDLDRFLFFIRIGEAF